MELIRFQGKAERNLKPIPLTPYQMIKTKTNLKKKKRGGSHVSK